MTIPQLSVRPITFGAMLFTVIGLYLSTSEVVGFMRMRVISSKVITPASEVQLGPVHVLGNNRLAAALRYTLEVYAPEADDGRKVNYQLPFSYVVVDQQGSQLAAGSELVRNDRGTKYFVSSHGNGTRWTLSATVIQPPFDIKVPADLIVRASAGPISDGDVKTASLELVLYDRAMELSIWRLTGGILLVAIGVSALVLNSAFGRRWLSRMLGVPIRIQ